MKSKTVHSLIISLILMVGHITPVQAVTDAELEAIEKQIEQLEVEEKKTEAEAKQKAEKKRKTETEAKKKTASRIRKETSGRRGKK